MDFTKPNGHAYSCLPLTPYQCRQLRTKHRIYLPDNGRINISGLNPLNIGRFSRAIASVLQNENSHL